MALADYPLQVDDLVRDQGGILSPETRERTIASAVLRYSADFPRAVVEDVTWPALGVFGPVPPGWSDGAVLRGAEYPIGQQPPSVAHLGAYRTPGNGWGLEAVQALPAGAQVRVSYAADHTLDTIPARHGLAVAQYAASLLCHQLATYYSGQRETATGSDFSQTETRAREYAARAKELRTAYYVGTNQPDPYARPAASTGSGEAPAGAFVTWPGRNRNRLVRGVL